MCCQLQVICRIFRTSHVNNSCANKKAFQLHANRPLADSPRFIVNKFEHDWGGVPYIVRSKLNKFKHIAGGALYSEVQVEQV